MTAAEALEDRLLLSVDVTKTNPLPLYMHYMPWFETPETVGANRWGFHWTLANQDPNVIDAQGQRQIASHFYPLIGPYASSDPHVIEYHLLLMKLSGIDGVVVNWYGTQGTNGDVGSLLANSNALIDRVDDFGLDFGVVLEDRFSGSIADAKANMAYLRDNYFANPAYIRQGPADDPLVMVFGPITFEQPAQWTEILTQAGEDVDLLPLWYESNDAGANADGEFAWIFENEATDDHLDRVSNFYQNRTPNLDVAGGVAYPGFVDFYEEGGLGNIVPFEIPHNGGQTLDSLLTLAEQNTARMDFLQLATWNDFGEGTVFEPTVETGFDYLVKLQQFSGTPFGEADLQLVHDLYLARKQFAGNPSVQGQLDQVSALLSDLWISVARSLLESIANESTLAIAADQASVVEGNAGLPATTPYTFTITRTGNTTVTTSVSYSVSGDGPNAATPTDFLGPTSGTIGFNPGETSKQITIRVIGDTQAEPDETFQVSITSISPDTIIGTGAATGTITNDDLTPNIEIVRGILYVRDASGRTDNITVSRSGTNIVVADPGNQFLVRLGTTNTLTNTAVIPYRNVTARRIVFDLGEQSDVLTIDNTLPTSMRVMVNGGAGDDVITAGLCTVVINGDEGDDVLSASPTGTTSRLGAVSLNGGSGIDILTGGNANDTLNGGSDGDSIVGGAGNDKLYGEAGSDTIYGGLGNDLIDGGTESDTAYGEAGIDTVFGGDGDDLLYGDSDVASVTDRGDKLYGGAGSDQIFGGGGYDVAYGDTTVNSAAGGGNDVISGGTGNDVLRGGSGNDCLFGDAGNDYLLGDDDNDTLDAGTENDTIVGGNGNDAILGGDGADRLYGDFQASNSTGSHNGNDTISGGAGNDQLYGGAGNDYLAGEAGSDLVRGETGTDTITGGSGLGPDVGDSVTDTASDINHNLVLVFNNITKLFQIMGV